MDVLDLLLHITHIQPQHRRPCGFQMSDLVDGASGGDDFVSSRKDAVDELRPKTARGARYEPDEMLAQGLLGGHCG